LGVSGNSSITCLRALRAEVKSPIPFPRASTSVDNSPSNRADFVPNLERQAPTSQNWEQLSVVTIIGICLSKYFCIIGSCRMAFWVSSSGATMIRTLSSGNLK